MIKRLTSPVSEALNEAEIQDESKYSNFIEHINLVLKQDRFSLFSRNTFDRKTDDELRRKWLMPLLIVAIWILALAAAGVVLISLNTILPWLKFFNITPDFTLTWNLISTGLGGSAIGTWVLYNRLKSRPDSHDSEGLIEETSDFGKAKIVQNWLQSIIDNNKRLFIKDLASGKIYKFTEVLPKTRNNLLSLLGDEKHRKTLGIKGLIPQGPILYLKDDEDYIFQELEVHLFPVPVPVPVPEPEPKLGPKLEPKRRPVADDNKSKLERRRTEVAKVRRTYYEKSSPKAHDYLHLQAILNCKDMMKLFVDFSGTDEFWDSVVKGNKTRTLWTKVFIFIYENWNNWEAYTDSPNTKSEFIDALFGPDYLNILRSSSNRKSFRLGKHREMSNFIIACYVIPVSEEGKDLQTDLFQK